ncbi:MAG: hypothetical protein J0L59_08800 [Xanthomonadales bacterium]|nr:hypothetical protein [Xanthomonadales bacterium]
MKFEAMTQADMDRMPDDDLRTLEKSTQKLADETQRQAAHYQRQADRMRKMIKQRKRDVERS